MAPIREVSARLVGSSSPLSDFGSGSDYLLVKITDENGECGIGYVPEIFRITGDDSLGRSYEHLVSKVLAPLLIGKDAEYIEEIWEYLFEKTTRWGRRGMILSCIGALDVALWDLFGKTSNKPVYKILGGYRKNIPVYANILDDLSADELASKAKNYVEKGFNAIKIRGALTSVSTNEATERVMKVREAIGYDVDLMLDLNATYTLQQAVRALKKWEKYDLLFVEEPLHPDNVEGFKRLKKEVDVQIAAGEEHSTLSDFKILLDSGAVDIIQPDPVYVGGVSQWAKVCALSRSYGVPLSPHLNQIVSAHLVGSRSNAMWIEYAAPDNPLARTMYALFKGPESIMQVQNGSAEIPDDPGFGFVVNESERE